MNPNGHRGEGGPRAAPRRLKVRLRRGKQRPASSQRWLERQLNDPYVAAARRQGYRSRAAYKLSEIDDRHGLLKPGRRVIDLGAAPGGWSQVAAERVDTLGVRGGRRGQVVAVDLLPCQPIPGVEFVQLDFLNAAAPARLQALLRGGCVDVALSDMAAPGSGHARTDHLRIIALAEAAAEFALSVLAPGGAFLCKVFQGGTERELLAKLRGAFTTIKHLKPPASRAQSAELYVLALGFRGRPASATG
jgi:23S rRNA (uridine2552-2'-O)-methyltransferase